jgi:hypothetical protein
MQVDAIAPGQTIIIIDDIIATGTSVSRAFATRKPLTNGPSSSSWESLHIFQVDRLLLQANSLRSKAERC